MSDDVAIVIPAYNEAGTIGDVVSAVAGLGRVIVIDDHSTDDTGRNAHAAGADVIRHEHNQGYDRALDSGFRHAAELGCEFVITLDADGQHPIRKIDEFKKRLLGGADMVLGVRDRLPRVSERIFAAITRRYFGIEDPCCGMKGYRMELFRSLGHFDRYNSIGTELMLHAVRNGAIFEQVPFRIHDRTDRPRFGNVLAANMKVFRAAILGLAKDGNRRNAIRNK